MKYQKSFIDKSTVNTADSSWHSNPYTFLLITNHRAKGITAQTVGLGKLTPGLSLRAKGKKRTKQNGVKNLLFMQKLHLGDEMKNNLIFKGLVLL